MPTLTKEELLKRADEMEYRDASIYDVQEHYTTGIYENLHFESYCALPGLNPSTIVKCDKSPFAAKWAYENQLKETEFMRRGRFCHTLLLEPERMREDWVMFKGSRQTKGWKDAEAEALLDHKGIIYSDGEMGYGRAIEIVDNALKFRGDDLKPIIGRGVSEVAMFLKYKGVQSKGRFDWLNTDDGILTDFKFQSSVDERSVKNAVSSFRYNVKLPTYKAWFEKITGKQVKKCCLVFIQTTEEPDVSIKWLPDDIIEDGIAQMGKHVDTIVEELRLNQKRMVSGEPEQWPGVDDGKVDNILDVPWWAQLEDQKEVIE